MSGFSGALCNDDRFDFPLKEKSGNTPKSQGQAFKRQAQAPSTFFIPLLCGLPLRAILHRKIPGK